MSEIYIIVLSASITVLSGTLVYVFGQIISKLFIEAINEQHKVKGEIVDSLIRYANLYSNPGTGRPEKMNEASEILRQLASQLIAKTYAIKFYKFWQSIRIVPTQKDMNKVCNNLIGLSNCIHQTDPKIIGQLVEQNARRREEIGKLLGVKHE